MERRDATSLSFLRFSRVMVRELRTGVRGNSRQLLSLAVSAIMCLQLTLSHLSCAVQGKENFGGQRLILELLNLTSFKILKEGDYVPLIFNRTRHSAANISLQEFGNSAVAPSALMLSESLGSNDYLTVFIRANLERHGRWGNVNIMGILDVSSMGLKLNLQPSDQRTRKRSRSFPRERFHNQMNTHVSGDVLWLRPLCRVPHQLKDVRIFYTRANGQALTCVVAAGNALDELFNVVCLNINYGHKEDVTVGGGCAEVAHVTRVRQSDPLNLRHTRNNVPLVRANHENWSMDKDVLWLFDAIGSDRNQPFIYPISLDISSASRVTFARSGSGLELADCAHTVDWRGSSPVVQFTDTLWITVLHKRVNVPKSDNNPLGRRYPHKVLLLEADTYDGLPSRCKYDEGDDILLEEPGPFVFILGLIHVRLVVQDEIGSVHRFLLSGAIDDFQPVLHTFDIFIPAAV